MSAIPTIARPAPAPAGFRYMEHTDEADPIYASIDALGLHQIAHLMMGVTPAWITERLKGRPVPAEKVFEWLESPWPWLRALALELCPAQVQLLVGTANGVAIADIRGGGYADALRQSAREAVCAGDTRYRAPFGRGWHALKDQQPEPGQWCVVAEYGTRATAGGGYVTLNDIYTLTGGMWHGIASGDAPAGKVTYWKAWPE